MNATLLKHYCTVSARAHLAQVPNLIASKTTPKRALHEVNTKSLEAAFCSPCQSFKTQRNLVDAELLAWFTWFCYRSLPKTCCSFRAGRHLAKIHAPSGDLQSPLQGITTDTHTPSEPAPGHALIVAGQAGTSAQSWASTWNPTNDSADQLKHCSAVPTC